MLRKTLRRSRSFTALAAALALCAAPVSIAVSQSGVRSISQQDKQEGAKAHPQLVAEFGGAVQGPQASYVEGVGKTIAVQSGLGNARDDFTVTLLNSPVNNAFAIPGGYVYVTRQLVALMNNEAELAGVLGHEVGHVAARHAAKRENAANRNAVIGLLGSILSGVLLGDTGFGQLGQKLFSQGSQLLTLKYSRSQESEADNLGITYLQRAGYDPRAMASVLQSLANQNALEARLRGTSADQTPEWASTHPDPASRVRAALERAGRSAGGVINRDTFLTRIDGLTYGDDPAQGIVDGRTFVHPGLRLQFQAPEGFFLVNGTRAVSISGQSGKGEFSSAAFDGDLNAYVGRVFASLSGQSAIDTQSIRRTTVNGLPAAYAATRARTNSGQVDVVVFAYELASDKAFHFVTISQPGRAGVFDSMFSSLRRLRPNEASAIRARKLQVVTVKAGDTMQSLAQKMAYDSAQLDRFQVLNGLSENSRLAPGQRVKLVTY